VPPAVSAAASFAAGVLSFASPCVLPLIGAYLSAIGASAAPRAAGGGDGAAKAPPLVLLTACFAAGFGAVFTAMSALVYGFMLFLGGFTRIAGIAAGALIIVLGANTLFDFIPFLRTARAEGGGCETCAPEGSVIRPRGGRRPAGIAGAFLTGAAFAVTWTPCAGVMLGSILVMASESGRLLSACLYLLLYALGMAIPFLAFALLWDAAARRGFAAFTASGRFRRISRAVRLISGVFLVLLGVYTIAGAGARL